MIRRKIAYLLSMIMLFSAFPVNTSQVYAQADINQISEVSASEIMMADLDLSDEETDPSDSNETAPSILNVNVEGDILSYSLNSVSTNIAVTVKVSDVVVLKDRTISGNRVSIRELVMNNLDMFTGKQVLDTVSVSIDNGESLNRSITPLYRLDVATVSGGKVTLDGSSDVLSLYDYVDGTDAREHTIEARSVGDYIFMGWNDGDKNSNRRVKASSNVTTYIAQFSLYSEVEPVLVATVGNRVYRSNKTNEIYMKAGETVKFSASKPAGADKIVLGYDGDLSQYFSRTAANTYVAKKQTMEDYVSFYATAYYGTTRIDSEWIDIYIEGAIPTATRVNLSDFRDYITEGYTLEFKAKASNDSVNLASQNTKLVISEGSDYVDSVEKTENASDMYVTFKIKFKAEKLDKGTDSKDIKFKIMVGGTSGTPCTIDSDTETEKKVTVYSDPVNSYNVGDRTMSYKVPAKVNTGIESGKDSNLSYTQDNVSEVKGIRLNVLLGDNILGTTSIASNRGLQGTINTNEMEMIITNLSKKNFFKNTCTATFRAYPSDGSGNCNKKVYHDTYAKVYEVVVKIKNDKGFLIDTHSFYGLQGQTIDVSSLGKFKTLTNGITDVAADRKIVVNESESKNVYEGIIADGSTETITKITLDKSSIELNQGETETVKITVSPSTATPGTIGWTSSDDEIATIANNPSSMTGNSMTATITAGSKEGTATLTASSGNVKTTLKVKVIMPVKFDRHTMTLVSRAGSMGKITPMVAGSYSVDTLVWSSSDQKVATVDKGIVTAATNLTESATAVITAETPDKKYRDTCVVTVNTMPVASMPVASRYSGELTKGTKILLTTATQGADIYYTTDNTSPSFGSDVQPAGPTKLYGDAITIAADTVIRAISVRDGYKNSDESIFSYTIKKDWNEIDPAMQKLFGDDIARVPQGIWYVFDGDSTVYTEGKTTAYVAEYTGNKIEINNDVHVFYGTNRLWENRDYSILYKNNTKVGAATLIISGKGNYRNSVTFKFNISKADIDKAEISSEKTVAVKSGTKINTIKPVLIFNGRKLELNKDYVLAYDNPSLSGNKAAISASSTVKSGVGYRITINASKSGNFRGTKNETIEVKAVNPSDRSVVMMNNVKVTVPKRPWNGKGVSAIDLFDNSLSKNAVAVVKNGKYVLKYGSDFTVDDEVYTDAGKYQLNLHGKGKYIGDKIVTIQVVGTPSGKVKVACMSTTVEYAGRTISINDLYRRDKTGYNKITLYTLQGKGYKPLQENNYDIEMTNSGAIGKFNMIFNLKGAYSGVIKKTVTVKPYDISKDNRKKITVSCNSASFCKAGSIPYVIVRFGNEVLTEGIDYTLSYKNNMKAAAYNAKKAPTVVVKGIGNFRGSRKVFYTINKADVSNIVLSVADKEYKAKASKGYFKASPKLLDDGKALSIGRGKDIEKLERNAYKYYYAETGEEIPEKAVVPLNTMIEVRVKITCSASSSYKAGTYDIRGFYRLIGKNKDISKATVKVKNPEKLSFTRGDEIIPLKSENLIVKLNKKTLDPSDYEIVSIKNNRFRGTATVILRGKGQYGGTRNFKFKINARNI